MSSSAALSFNEALSGITGAISLAAWVFLLIPQLLENYRAQSSAGISKLFLLIWLAGDVCNLAGAIWAGLVPTIIALGVYFCFSDATLIIQCIYYDLRNRGKPSDADADAADGGSEHRPLLRSVSNELEYGGPPGSGRRMSFRRTADGNVEGLLAVGGRRQQWRALAKNLAAILGVCAVGTCGWTIAYRLGWWEPVPVSEDGDEARNPGAEILGYASAVLYLSARLPQIYKNWIERSCEGLSLLFFILSLLGNLTQGATILFHSVEVEYFLKNLPWLLGSLGTMAEDITIFIQFRLYNLEANPLEVAVD